jgi:predicted aspartyl protease
MELINLFRCLQLDQSTRVSKQIFEFKSKLFMGTVYAEVELINWEDISRARRHQIGEDEIRCMRVNMLVDSGSFMMALNETIRDYLGLPLIEEKRRIELANGKIVELDVVGPIEVKFANRKANCTAFVLPGDSEPLLGAIPMEEMDVLIHPKRGELVVHSQYLQGAGFRL